MQSSFMFAVKISKDYFSSTSRVNPWLSTCLNSNPKASPSLSKDFFGFIINLVIERMCLGFQKTSSCESIQCCRFTGFLCIRICFSVRIEAVNKIYSSIRVYPKSGTDTRRQWKQNYGLIWWGTSQLQSKNPYSVRKIKVTLPQAGTIYNTK